MSNTLGFGMWKDGKIRITTDGDGNKKKIYHSEKQRSRLEIEKTDWKSVTV